MAADSKHERCHFSRQLAEAGEIAYRSIKQWGVL